MKVLTIFSVVGLVASLAPSDSNKDGMFKKVEATDSASDCADVARIYNNIGIRADHCLVNGNNIFFRLEHHYNLWHEAEEICHLVTGGHLASIHSFDEQLTLHQLARESKLTRHGTGNRANGVIIGLHAMPNQPVKWSDGSAIDYEEWHLLNCNPSDCDNYSGPPLSSAESCGHFKMYALSYQIGHVNQWSIPISYWQIDPAFCTGYPSKPICKVPKAT